MEEGCWLVSEAGPPTPPASPQLTPPSPSAARRWDHSARCSRPPRLRSDRGLLLTWRLRSRLVLRTHGKVCLGSLCLHLVGKVSD